MSLDEITLTLPDPIRPRFFRAAVHGRRVTRWSWTRSGKPRESVADFSSDAEAVTAFRKAVDAKMRTGFVFVRDARDASPGEIILETVAPNRPGGAVLDLAPHGRTLVIASMLKRAYGAEIHLMDVATGQSRRVHAEPSGQHHTVVHAVLFDATGEQIVYALNGETRRLDLTTGQTSVLAGYDTGNARFNEYCVRPCWDGTRSRLLVFDAADRVKVLDAGGEPVLDVSVALPTTVCWAGALSTSGRLLALHRVSRGIIYSHHDALHDTTNEIEIWDVDAAAVVQRLPVTFTSPTDGVSFRIGFDPTDTLLLSNKRCGPSAITIATGVEAWRYDDTDPTQRFRNVCFTWAYSADGAWLVIGRRATSTYKTRTPGSPRRSTCNNLRSGVFTRQCFPRTTVSWLPTAPGGVSSSIRLRRILEMTT